MMRPGYVSASHVSDRMGVACHWYTRPREQMGEGRVAGGEMSEVWPDGRTQA